MRDKKLGQMLETPDAPGMNLCRDSLVTPVITRHTANVGDMVFQVGQEAVDKWKQRSNIVGSVCDIPVATAMMPLFSIRCWQRQRRMARTSLGLPGQQGWGQVAKRKRQINS